VIHAELLGGGDVSDKGSLTTDNEGSADSSLVLRSDLELGLNASSSNSFCEGATALIIADAAEVLHLASRVGVHLGTSHVQS
jgi:hypothetical protein